MLPKEDKMGSRYSQTTNVHYVFRSQTETYNSRETGGPRLTQYLSFWTRFLRLQAAKDKISHFALVRSQLGFLEKNKEPQEQGVRHSFIYTFAGTQMVKNLPATQETRVWSLGWEDTLEKGMVTQFSILAWRIPWTEESDRLQSMGLQRVRHDWATNTSTFFLQTCLFILPLNIHLPCDKHWGRCWGWRQVLALSIKKKKNSQPRSIKREVSINSCDMRS